MRTEIDVHGEGGVFDSKSLAFLPAEAHVPQNPVLVIIKVDLSSRREERMGQFTCGAIKTVMEVGLQTICVIYWVEACQKKWSACIHNSSSDR